MIVQKLQIAARVPRIVTKGLFDLPCPLDANWVSVEQYCLRNVRAGYRNGIFLVRPCIAFFGFWGSYILTLEIRTVLNFSKAVEQKHNEKYDRNKRVKMSDINASGKNRCCNEYPQGSFFVPCVRYENAEKKKPCYADAVKDELNHRIHSLLMCFGEYCVVPLHVIFRAPIRKIATRMRENIALLHYPARRTGFPFVPGKGFVLVGYSTIDVFPNLIDTMQIVSTFDQLSFSMLREALKNFLTRARNESFVRFIRGHHKIPFSDSFCAVVTCPKRHRVLPVQVVRLLGINLRASSSPKNQKEYGDE